VPQVTGSRNAVQFGSLTLTLFRWLLRNAGVEKGAEIGSLELAHFVAVGLEERRRWV
jgi:hypothetical protein